MSDTPSFDIAIIGGGIIGLATALKLSEHNHFPGHNIAVLEAEDRLAPHQTGNNSGVIHSGLYYKPGSLKARNCTLGREALYRFCEKHDIPHQRCGKVVIATHQEELPRMERLLERGKANGLKGIRRLDREQIGDYEPACAGIAGLHVPETGITNYTTVCEKFSDLFRDNGGDILLNTRVSGVTTWKGEMILATTSGVVRCKNLINCAGLQSDRVARMCGLHPDLKIVPFRGEYHTISKEREYLVNNLIYPVPDPQFPFLGVHFTRMIEGGVEAGPNAVLALKREGYNKFSFSARDFLENVTFPGFWRMIKKHWRMGLHEQYRSLNKAAFVRALQRLVPEIRTKDIRPASAGVRARALERTGFLVDDFRIKESKNMVHVLNAPSPAATASLNIGEAIARIAHKNFASSTK